MFIDLPFASVCHSASPQTQTQKTDRQARLREEARKLIAGAKLKLSGLDSPSSPTKLFPSGGRPAPAPLSPDRAISPINNGSEFIFPIGHHHPHRKDTGSPAGQQDPTGKEGSNGHSYKATEQHHHLLKRSTPSPSKLIEFMGPKSQEDENGQVGSSWVWACGVWVYWIVFF